MKERKVIHINRLSIKYNTFSPRQFIELWKTAWDQAPSEEQVRLAFKNTLFRVSMYDNDKIIAMGRMIGDLGMCYYIRDVVVRPEYRRHGMGSIIIGECLKYIKNNSMGDTDVYVELSAMPDVIPFYEKFGFTKNDAQSMKLSYHVK